jgi:hypothetical protein
MAYGNASYAPTNAGDNGQGHYPGMSPWQDLFSGLGAWFGGQSYQDPSKAAMPYFQNAQNQMTAGFQPYMDAGKNSLNSLQDQINKLLSNPGGFMNQIGQGFQQSPGFKFDVDQATGAANRAAAAGGMLGSPAEQQELAGTVNGIANQDYYNWLSKALGLYGQGMNSAGDIAKLGQQSASEYGHDTTDLGESEANFAYEGAKGANEARQGAWGGLAGAAGDLLGGNIFGGQQGGQGGGDSIMSSIAKSLAHLFL